MSTIKIISLIIIIISVIFLAFISLMILISKLTKKSIENAPKYIYKVNIDLKNKQVSIIKNDHENSTSYVELDEFIYFIGITPDSKPFRDLLKMINNNAKKELIIDSINNLPEDVIYSFSIPNQDAKTTRQTLVGMYFSSLVKTDKNFLLEIEEIAELEKEQIDELLDNNIILEDKKTIFSNIVKDIEKIKSKGWVLIKIDHKNKKVQSKKDFVSKKIKSLEIKKRFKRTRH